MTWARGDVFDARADAILMTFDGMSPGHWGNHARRFGALWEELFEEVLKDEVWRRKTPYGAVLAFERPELYDECPFRWILLASTLFTRPTSEDQKRAVMGRALMNALRAADRVGARHVAGTLLRGGWRVSTSDAFRLMARVYDAFEATGGRAELQIRVLDSAEYEAVSRAAAEVGLTGGRG